MFLYVALIGGYLSSSLAIATDAAHLLTDFASFMISLFALWVANRPPTQSMPFGWYRAEVIGALTSVLMIWIVTGILVYMAVERIIKKDFEIDAKIMLITSAVGVLVNIMYVSQEILSYNFSIISLFIVRSPSFYHQYQVRMIIQFDE